MAKIWNVRVDSIEPTTLGTEQIARRWETGRGYCVEAPDAKSARRIVTMHQFDTRYMEPVNRVLARDRGNVIVLSLAKLASQPRNGG